MGHDRLDFILSSYSIPGNQFHPNNLSKSTGSICADPVTFWCVIYIILSLYCSTCVLGTLLIFNSGDKLYVWWQMERWRNPLPVKMVDRHRFGRCDMTGIWRLSLIWQDTDMQDGVTWQEIDMCWLYDRRQGDAEGVIWQGTGIACVGQMTDDRRMQEV